MIKLTRQAEIAVHILMLCARPQSNAPVTTRVAAEFADTTKAHAAQVVAKLVRNGYLEGTRGRAGGIRLARPATRIPIGEVLRLLDPALGRVCPDDNENIVANGSFGAMVRAAMHSFVSTFDDFTIADLVGDPATGRIACIDCDLHTLFRKARTRRNFLRSQNTYHMSSSQDTSSLLSA